MGMEYWHTGALMSEENWFKLLLKRKDPEILDSMDTSVHFFCFKMMVIQD